MMSEKNIARNMTSNVVMTPSGIKTSISLKESGLRRESATSVSIAPKNAIC